MNPRSRILSICAVKMKTITMLFNVKNLPLAPQYRKRLLQINGNSVRNIHNHANVEKPSATCNNKRWFREQTSRFMGLETWDGWLIAGNTPRYFCHPDKFIVHGYILF